MIYEEIERCRKEKTEILKMKEPEKGQRLLALAENVGASTTHWARVGGEGNATESQLIYNIEIALQTASMIDMSKTAAKNYEIASRATKIALGSAIAAWAAVLAMVLVAILTR